MESPFASWMDRFSIEYPDQAPEKDPADALMSSLAQKGYAHEDALETAFVEQGLAVVTIEGESADEKLDSTLEASAIWRVCRFSGQSSACGRR